MIPSFYTALWTCLTAPKHSINTSHWAARMYLLREISTSPIYRHLPQTHISASSGFANRYCKVRQTALNQLQRMQVESNFWPSTHGLTGYLMVRVTSAFFLPTIVREKQALRPRLCRDGRMRARSGIRSWVLGFGEKPRAG